MCSIFTLLLSIVVGIFLAWNRLCDFHHTFKIVRLKQEKLDTNRDKQAQIDNEIDHKRKLTDRLGDISRFLLFVQSIIFVAGIALLLLAVASHVKII